MNEAGHPIGSRRVFSYFFRFIAAIFGFTIDDLLRLFFSYGKMY